MLDFQCYRKNTFLERRRKIIAQKRMAYKNLHSPTHAHTNFGLTHKLGIGQFLILLIHQWQSIIEVFSIHFHQFGVNPVSKYFHGLKTKDFRSSTTSSQRRRPCAHRLHAQQLLLQQLVRFAVAFFPSLVPV